MTPGLVGRELPTVIFVRCDGFVSRFSLVKAFLYVISGGAERPRSGKIYRFSICMQDLNNCCATLE